MQHAPTDTPMQHEQIIKYVLERAAQYTAHEIHLIQSKMSHLCTAVTFFYINGYCEPALKLVSLCFFKTRIIEGYCLQGIVTAVLLMASQLLHLQIHFLKSVQNLSHRLK